MSDLEREIEKWRRTVYGSNDPNKKPDENDYKSNMLYEQWTPRWKWFRPPMWKIFRWAYKIKRTLFTGVYPVAMGCDRIEMQSSMHSEHIRVDQRAKGDNVTQIGVVTFTGGCGQPFPSKVEEQADLLLKNLKDMKEKEGKEET